MTPTTARLAAWSLIAGVGVAIAGFAAGLMANGTGDDRFAGGSWPWLYLVALLGNALVLLGLPAVVHAQRGRFPRLTLVGYVGLFLALLTLNLGQGVVEGFAKPYLAHHGGIPVDDFAGLTGYEAVGVLSMVVGLICLGIAVLRARVLPRWIAVLFLISPVLGAAGLPIPFALLSDLAVFVALVGVAVHVLRASDGQSSQVDSRERSRTSA